MCDVYVHVCGVCVCMCGSITLVDLATGLPGWPGNRLQRSEVAWTRAKAIRASCWASPLIPFIMGFEGLGGGGRIQRWWRGQGG